MLPTLEARWFLPGAIPETAAAWFDSLGPDVTPESRTDRYLVPTESNDLGLKVREGRVEAKQRTRTLRATLANGRVEAWRKWSLGTADAHPEPGWLGVAKTRRQRHVRIAGRARCSLELAALAVGSETWWSVCLEASGETAAARWRALRAGAERWGVGELALPPDASKGYPEWLRARGG